MISFIEYDSLQIKILEDPPHCRTRRRQAVSAAGQFVRQYLSESRAKHYKFFEHRSTW